MTTRRPSSPRPKRAGGRANTPIDEGLRLRFRLSSADTALLRGLASDDEAPVNTIRRLIRTAGMVAPILTALEEIRQRSAGVPPVAQPAGGDIGQDAKDDAVRRQMDVLAGWMPDD